MFLVGKLHQDTRIKALKDSSPDPAQRRNSDADLHDRMEMQQQLLTRIPAPLPAPALPPAPTPSLAAPPALPTVPSSADGVSSFDALNSRRDTLHSLVASLAKRSRSPSPSNERNVRARTDSMPAGIPIHIAAPTAPSVATPPLLPSVAPAPLLGAHYAPLEAPTSVALPPILGAPAPVLSALAPTHTPIAPVPVLVACLQQRLRLLLLSLLPRPQRPLPPSRHLMPQRMLASGPSSGSQHAGESSTVIKQVLPAARAVMRSYCARRTSDPNTIIGCFESAEIAQWFIAAFNRARALNPTYRNVVASPNA
ncbi:hypothetical protein K438DRAFT_1968550 [Mycena galopus ATCC 62051]|nr:hypothetical protein K438DRAFT_1968550 [Mycena galopus ATCC 62051]